MQRIDQLSELTGVTACGLDPGAGVERDTHKGDPILRCVGCGRILVRL